MKKQLFLILFGRWKPLLENDLRLQKKFIYTYNKAEQYKHNLILHEQLLAT